MLLYRYVISLQDVLLIVTVAVLDECTVIYILCSSRGIEVPTTFPEVTQNIQRTHVGILVNNQLDTLFNVFIYFTSLHISSNPVLIIRRINCINTSSAMYHSV